MTKSEGCTLMASDPTPSTPPNRFMPHIFWMDRILIEQKVNKTDQAIFQAGKCWLESCS